jgi:hypothetical protein
MTEMPIVFIQVPQIAVVALADADSAVSAP